MSGLTNRQKTKNRYRAARKVQPLGGPGIWITCPMGKEKQVIGEMYDVLESIAENVWPTTNQAVVSDSDDDDEDHEEDEEEDMEKQLAKELAEIKRPQRETRRIKSLYVDTKCLAFMACRPPLDPVRLTLEYFEEIEREGKARTRNVLRLLPVVSTCVATPTDIAALASRVVPPSFQVEPHQRFRYKINTQIRNNTKLRSAALIPEIARCVPGGGGHVVDLDNPELVILVEIYQSVCGISVVPDWLKYKRFNVLEYSQMLGRKVGHDLALDPPRVVKESPAGSGGDS